MEFIDFINKKNRDRKIEFDDLNKNKESYTKEEIIKIQETIKDLEFERYRIEDELASVEGKIEELNDKMDDILECKNIKECEDELSFIELLRNMKKDNSFESCLMKAYVFTRFDDEEDRQDLKLVRTWEDYITAIDGYKLIQIKCDVPNHLKNKAIRCNYEYTTNKFEYSVLDENEVELNYNYPFFKNIINIGLKDSKSELIHKKDFKFDGKEYYQVYSLGDKKIAINKIYMATALTVLEDKDIEVRYTQEDKQITLLQNDMKIVLLPVRVSQ